MTEHGAYEFIEVPISKLKPNPFRNLDEYPIQREKVDALKQSIEVTGYWGNINARPAKNGTYEITFGHHRLMALTELYKSTTKIPILARELSNESMLQMMARENMEEWGSSAWVEVETVKAVVLAYAEGAIKLPPLDPKTKKSLLRQAPLFTRADVSSDTLTHPYTLAQVGEFLGWTTKTSHGTLQPNYACRTAFEALEGMELGVIKPAQLKGLSREQSSVLVAGAMSAYRSRLEEAEAKRKAAEEERKAAEKAEGAERERREQRAKVLATESRQLQKAAVEKVQALATDANQRMRAGQAAVRDIRQEATTWRAESKPKKEKTVDVDELANKIGRVIYRLLNDDDDVSAWMEVLVQFKEQCSGDAMSSLRTEIDALIKRLEGCKKKLVVK